MWCKVWIIYEGWEPNQRATIQKFAHGMKPKRSSSFSGKNSLKMQSARPSGPKLDYYFLFLLLFLLFFLIFLIFPSFLLFFCYCFLFWVIFPYFFLCFVIFLYFVTYDFSFFIIVNYCSLFVFIIVYFLRPLIRCPLNRLPILIEDWMIKQTLFTCAGTDFKTCKSVPEHDLCTALSIGIS